jgi:hypothetical protein
VCNPRFGPLVFAVQYVTYDVRTLRSKCMDEKTERFEMRVPASFLEMIDDWRRIQPDLPSRAAAIRRLVELGLTLKTKAKQPSPRSAARAKELAAKAIDKMIDAAAPPKERAHRKRRLTKGPSEFQDVRVDLPKLKRK